MRVKGLFAVVLAMATAGTGQSYELRGRIVDEAFQPLAGAAVAAGCSGALETGAVLAAPAATSSADGYATRRSRI